jgi:hypothetical protein
MPSVRWVAEHMQEHDPGITVVEVYDPATDAWARKADMPRS